MHEHNEGIITNTNNFYQEPRSRKGMQQIITQIYVLFVCVFFAADPSRSVLSPGLHVDLFLFSAHDKQSKRQ